MKFKGTLLLLIASCIIGSLYLFYLLPVAEEKKLREELASRFFRMEREKLEFLRIHNRKGIFNIAKEGETWKISAPMHLPTDDITIQRVLSLITEGKILKIITSDMKRASEFQLDVPRTALYIGYGGKIDELIIGSRNPSKTGFYAFVKGINAIFLVDEEIAQLMNIGLYELRSKSLFRYDPDTISDIKILKYNGEITLRKERTRWMVTHPFSGRASADDVEDFLNGILYQKADEFYDNRVPDANDYSKAITVFLSSDTNDQQRIDVYYWGTGANEGSVAYQKGMKYSGRLTRDFWIFIDRNASDFRYRNLFDFDEDNIGRIRIRKDITSYDVIRKGDLWYSGDQMADENKITELIWFFKVWKAEKFLDPVRKSAIGRVLYSVEIHDKKGTAQGSLKIHDKIEGESLGYSSEGEEYFLHYAISDNLKNHCAISSLEMRKIPGREDILH